MIDTAIARIVFSASAMAVFSLAFPTFARGLEIEPLSLTNLSPLVHSSGVPRETSAHILPNGRWQLSLAQDIASIYTKSSSGNEQLLFDGELYRSTLAVRYGVFQAFEIGVELPVITQGGGFLDQTISNWHSFWGLPQGGRDSATNNQLSYRYSKNGVQQINMQNSGTDIGDVSVQAAFQLLDNKKDSTRNTLALRGQIKLPTGDSNQLTGNGSTSAAILLAASSATENNYGTFGFFGSVGGVASNTGSVLPDQQKHLVGFSTLGAGWSPHNDINLKMQLNLTTPLYDTSKLNEISSPTAFISLGATFRLTPQYMLDLGFSEDIAVATAPDIMFQLKISRFM